MNAPVVAVVGGGQLARMMVPAATALGIHLRVLVESPTGSAAQVVVDAPVGQASDEAAISAIAEGADALTFEHEHVPNALLDRLAAAGVAVRPDAAALVHAQDKIVMRRRLTALGVPCPRWAPVTERDDLAAFLADQPDGTAVVKTARGGYDGKGVRVVASPDAADDWLAAAARPGGVPVLVEEKVPYTRELAVLVARRPSGEVRTWPVVESVQRDGVCAEVVAPAPDLADATRDEALAVAVRVAEGLGVVGVLAVELFEVPGAAGEPPRVLVNELAMRPHNSGHWTIDGAVTSQFEQHLRAVLDLPLGDPAPRARWTVMANVLGSTLEDLTHALPRVAALDPGAKVQLYGKDVRPGRKLGHVNVSGDDLDEVRARALAAAALLRGETL
ncbi:MAG: 5-(carboxyamino)imidazole ribonucleotide synthase [Cellulomonas sp.]|uniref:N5-carboxyaminoimidazole ribonucleotide synthase n=1 Tax=Cellulomonas gelida TaxID=1712 RepID=A0A4Y3KGE0_9CELL|nr:MULTISPECIES: 5-(carboxyamino)imidazole ribonucleotide synthase [Cellulomonas]KMM44506.1 phosphoribosylaminoimidazole carboxylase [Cellulomonas sp. A375-1]MCR6648040.1 5-(carboxyamino)imidazole ribonucleotide synthase [Cellulomonas sp.]GEA83541.1 N5-carboxyaminoimidazole ribonucleotide synthase [Cellulomonas gelida]GGL24158.1 N5-carboxyaminoimidazole ribonucleotide synthase [Cellulomonas gelida]